MIKRVDTRDYTTCPVESEKKADFRRLTCDELYQFDKRIAVRALFSQLTEKMTETFEAPENFPRFSRHGEAITQQTKEFMQQALSNMETKVLGMIKHDHGVGIMEALFQVAGNYHPKEFSQLQGSSDQMIMSDWLTEVLYRTYHKYEHHSGGNKDPLAADYRYLEDRFASGWIPGLLGRSLDWSKE